MFINIPVKTPHLTCQILYFTAATNKFLLLKQNCKNKRRDQDKGMHSIHKHSTHPDGHSGMDSVIILHKVPLTNKLLICGLYIYLTGEVGLPVKTVVNIWVPYSALKYSNS